MFTVLAIHSKGTSQLVTYIAQQRSRKPFELGYNASIWAIFAHSDGMRAKRIQDLFIEYCRKEEEPWGFAQSQELPRYWLTASLEQSPKAWRQPICQQEALLLRKGARLWNIGATIVMPEAFGRKEYAGRA